VDGSLPWLNHYVKATAAPTGWIGVSNTTNLYDGGWSGGPGNGPPVASQYGNTPKDWDGGLSSPIGVAVDPVGGKIFVAEMWPGTIHSYMLSSGAAGPVTTTSASSSCRSATDRGPG
jgi:sugar lactone lactonase YvrE